MINVKKKHFPDSSKNIDEKRRGKGKKGNEMIDELRNVCERELKVHSLIIQSTN